MLGWLSLVELGTKKEELDQKNQTRKQKNDKMGTITGTLTAELAWNKQKKL